MPPKAAARNDRTHANEVGPAESPIISAASTDFVWLTPVDSYRRAATISVLPDNILLEIFCLYRDYDQPYREDTHPVWGWYLLVHICRRWRQVVFASPLRLDLRIFSTSRNLVGKNLCIWPALPIIVDFDFHSNRRHGNNASSEDNIIAALEHADRVCEVGLCATCSELEKFTAVMQAPFPMLKSLHIWSGNAQVLPTEFLGGSAPCLQRIHLDGIPFPALPTLLLSTTDLRTLYLGNIPATGYISPEAMVVGLAALPRLESFVIGFQLATSRPDRMHPPPVTRTVLPALTTFEFQGASDYLEGLIARIDAPQLKRIYIRYLNQLVDLRIAQLPLFINRSVGPKLTQFRNAQVAFSSDQVTFYTYCHKNNASPDELDVVTAVLCEGIDWQVSHLTQVLSQFSATLPNMVHLKLNARLEEDSQLEDTDNVEWLHLLHQVPTVQTLHVSNSLAGKVALALEGIAWETAAETPPESLDLIYLADQPASSIENFVAARRLSGRPVTVIDTIGEFDERVGDVSE